MNMLVLILISLLIFWMLACAYCGYHLRILRFFAVLMAGLALNMAWMMIGLNARLFEINALIAQASAALYACAAFGCGWLAGRIMREWRASRVDSGGV